MKRLFLLGFFCLALCTGCGGGNSERDRNVNKDADRPQPGEKKAGDQEPRAKP